EDPMGQTVKINRLSFQVIGVFNERLAENPYHDPNDFVVIPISTAAADFFGRDASVFATAEVVSEESIEEAMEQIKTYLRQMHDIDPTLGEEDDFELHSMERVLKAQQESADIFATLLAGMAAVSLTVGGIGIMNVMLVSVTERTREIGVRKALGARRWDIVQQFLLEAVALSMTGGLLGVATGILAIPAITRYNPKIAATFTWQSVPQAFACALLAGIVFGLYPALRASWLDPIEALRYE
ncbi:MAG: FtsX-like permease family protein, partial [Chloroflexota bacterium]|nr:FtsX-like permease family protein [Chloroflexota bacterium]